MIYHASVLDATLPVDASVLDASRPCTSQPVYYLDALCHTVRVCVDVTGSRWGTLGLGRMAGVYQGQDHTFS